MSKILQNSKEDQKTTGKSDSLQNNQQQSEWKTIGVKVKMSELPVLNRQLIRLNYDTLGNLVKDLMAGKLTHVTEDQQIDIMNANLQTTGQMTGLSGKPYDFYKQIDIDDLHKYLIEKYHEPTGNSYRNYFEKYPSIFFGPNPEAITDYICLQITELVHRMTARLL